MALPQRHVAEDSLELDGAGDARRDRSPGSRAATAVGPHRRGTRRPQRHLEGDVVEDRERGGVAEPGDARPPRFGRRRAGHLVLQGTRGGARRAARSIGRGSGHRAAWHRVGHRYQLLGSMRGRGQAHRAGPRHTDRELGGLPPLPAHRHGIHRHAERADDVRLRRGPLPDAAWRRSRVRGRCAPRSGRADEVADHVPLDHRHRRGGGVRVQRGEDQSSGGQVFGGDVVRHGLRSRPWPWAWRTPHLRDTYDVVIVGAGVHGLATAYYLAEAGHHQCGGHRQGLHRRRRSGATPPSCARTT